MIGLVASLLGVGKLLMESMEVVMLRGLVWMFPDLIPLIDDRIANAMPSPNEASGF